MEAGRVRSEATWAGVREAYLAGAGAGEVCERFGVGLTALRDRAKREGWRRRDQADPVPDAAGDLDVTEAEVDPDDLDPAALADVVMIERAWRMAARALGRGRLREAQGWTRLVSDLRAAGQTRCAAAIQAADQNSLYQERLDASLAWVDRARRACAPPPRADSPDSPDSREDPDSARPYSAPSQECFTPIREDAKGRAVEDDDRAEGGGAATRAPGVGASAPDPPPRLNRAERRRVARLGRLPRDGP